MAAPLPAPLGAAVVAVPIETLRAPDRAAELVSNRERAAYESVLAAYRDALHAHPDDAALAVAECRYIQRFAWTEDLSWADAASKNLDACMATLDSRFAQDAEADLLHLESTYGEKAIPYSESLIPRSARWTIEQRARLHARLSRNYAAQNDERRAGEQALLTARLDPSNERLAVAIRYLAREKRVPEAVALLAAASPAKSPWLEVGRLEAALDVLPPSAALDELHRAEHAGLKVDPYLTARVLRNAGDPAKAQAVLAAVPAQPNEAVQRRQFRLDLAFENRDAATAAKVMGDWVKQTGSTTPLALSYAHLVALSPSRAFNAGLAPLAGTLVVYMLMLAVSPALLLFPVHYRGTVRARLGKPLRPLFGRIGLRHAWYGFAIYVVLLYMVPSFRSGSMELAYSDTLTSAAGQRQMAISQFWVLGCAAIGLAWLATRLSWTEWLGSGRWKLRWFVLPFLWFALIAFAHWYVLHAHTLKPVPPTPWILALIEGTRAIGGLPLVLLIVAAAVPLFEEFVFRACVLGGLSRHLSFGWSNVWQAALFATMHRDPPRWVFYFVLALIAGWLAKKTKGLAAPIALHALNNAVFVLLM